MRIFKKAKKSEWCCERFRFLLGNAGEKGCSIIATNQHHRKFFQIMARPFEREVLDELNVAISAYSPDHRTKSGKAIGIAVAAFLILQHCPFCGKDLGKLIKSHESEFDKLAEEHLQYNKAEYFK